MKNAMEALLGVNWRTCANGLMSTMFMLWSVWNIIPEADRYNWQKVWPILVAAIFKTWQDFQMKDRQVSGNSAMGFVVGTGDGEVRSIAPVGTKDAEQ